MINVPNGNSSDTAFVTVPLDGIYLETLYSTHIFELLPLT